MHQTGADAGPSTPRSTPSSPATSATQSPRPIRSSRDYDTATDDEDEDSLIYAAPSRHRASPSATRLLASQETVPGSPVSPQEERKQALLRRAYELGDEGNGDYGRRSKVWEAGESFKGFVQRNSGFLLIAAAQGFFASMSCCIKILQEEVDMPVWQIILVRMSTTWLGCYLYMRWTNVEYALSGPPGVRLLLAARGFVGFFGLFPGYFALKYLSLSDATVLSFLAPVLVGLLAFVLLKEPYSLTEALAGLFSLLGVVLIAKPTFLFPSAGPRTGAEKEVTPEERTFAVGVALCGTMGAAGAYVLIRMIGKRANALHSISYFAIWCCIVSCIYPLLFHSPPVFDLSWKFIGLIVPIALFGFCSQALLTLGLQREKAGRGTLAVYANLLFAMVLERLVFHRYPDFLSLLGAAVIVGCGVKVALEKSKMSSATKSVRTDEEERKAEEGQVLRRLSEEDDEETEAQAVDAVEGARR